MIRRPPRSTLFPYTTPSDLLFLTNVPVLFAGQPGGRLLLLSPEYSISGRGTKIGQLLDPLGIAVDPSGNIYVTDTGNNRLQKFSLHGALLAQIGGLGSGARQFDSPRSVGAANGIDVWVADYNNHRVQRFDRNLNLVFTFKANENWEERYQFQLPTDVRESYQGDIFVADGGSNCVIKYDGFRRPVAVFGGLDAGQGQIQEIGKLALSNAGEVYAADRQSGRIVVFDYFGNFAAIFSDSLLRDPEGLAFWNDEKILFVADPVLPGIEAFDPDGVRIPVKFIQQDPQFQLKRPVDVAVLGSRLFVLDEVQGKVFVFKLVSRKFTR